ncbi:MAG: hypothetical protein EOM19_04055 [Candidatus Moranbacteria bacterium]|nr:hypothetical protein [Candidatus Moranbacteria bacterium]
MENLFLLFITTVVILFVLIALICCLMIVMFIRKDKKTIEQSRLEISRNELKKAERQTEKSASDLENMKLQIKYEEMFKSLKEQGVSLAQGIKETYKDIDGGK